MSEAYSFEHLKDFKSFIESELTPALSELENIKDDSSRKHLQKLVYTNLVDRFDYAVDKTILGLVHGSSLTKELLGKLTASITEGDALKIIFFGENEKDNAIERLKDLARNEYLRLRHSKKLHKIFSVLNLEDHIRRPRVHRGTGQIMKTAKADKKTPLTIIGYADWLYSRRNAIVHGGGDNHLAKHDLEYIQTTFHCSPGKTIKIPLGTIRNVSRFYSDLTDIIVSPS